MVFAAASKDLSLGIGLDKLSTTIHQSVLDDAGALGDAGKLE